MKNIISKALLGLVVMTLTACGGAAMNFGLSSRIDRANDIALSSGFFKKEVKASPFYLTTFQKIDKDNTTEKTATVYIEGDGLAWVSKRQMSLDPTPTNPLAFELAALDPSNNVIYMARSCQYSKWIYNTACPYKYWTSNRFDTTVLKSYQTALDGFKEQYGFEEFHLVGFSGGGAVATLLASQRDDVKTLRTVAGNLDHDGVNAYHKVSMMPESLNPIDYAARTQFIPQTHYVGDKDKVVKPFISRDFINAIPKVHCAQQRIIPNVEHEKGWTDIWATLSTKMPDCEYFP